MSTERNADLCLILGVQRTSPNGNQGRSQASPRLQLHPGPLATPRPLHRHLGHTSLSLLASLSVSHRKPPPLAWGTLPPVPLTSCGHLSGSNPDAPSIKSRDSQQNHLFPRLCLDTSTGLPLGSEVRGSLHTPVREEGSPALPLCSPPLYLIGQFAK